MRPRHRHRWWVAGLTCAGLAATPLPAAVPPEATVAVAELDGPATVSTDRYGIPHIEAGSVADLYRCWGYITARDRLWQFQHARRAGRGELWAWFGNRSLRADGGAQLFELAARAARIWERERDLPEVRIPLEAYVAGINAYVSRVRAGLEPLPREFARLGVLPEFCRPEDVYVILFGLAFTLDFGLPQLAEADSLRAQGGAAFEARRRFEGDGVYRTIPDSAATRLYGGLDRTRGAPVSRHEGAPIRNPGLYARAREALGTWLPGAPREPDMRASNVFAVGPRRTERGAPLLANDPHLTLTAPNQLHVVHLSIPGRLDAIGAAVPGLPLIVSGRNRGAAWGLTALGAQVIDVYADTLSPDRRRVRSEGRWVPVREAGYTMKFRFGPLHLPTVGQVRRYTPHGPVVVWDADARIAYSARWAGRDQDITLRRLLGFEAAQRADSLEARVRSLVTPTMNFVAADATGQVLYRAVGAVPDRGFPRPPGPLPGDGTWEWAGLVLTGQMPAWRAPADGFVVNANNLPVGDAHPARWDGFDWFHDRARRIDERLAGDTRISLQDLRSVQNDVFSLGARRFVPRLLAATESLAAGLPPGARAARETLAAWDGLTRRDRVAPTLFRAWYGAFLRGAGLEEVPGLAAAVLDGRATLPGPTLPVGRLAARALESALGELATLLGPDPALWTWERAHRARPRHALAWLDSSFAPATIGIDGDNSTPAVARSQLPWSIHVSHVPVWRLVVDLADTETALGVIPLANSPFGETDGVALARWANHGYVPLVLGRERLAAITTHRVRLVPVAARGPAPRANAAGRN